MPLVPLQPAYPSSMEAMTAASRVVSKLRDTNAVTNEEAVQAGWIVLGFGASMGTGFLFQSPTIPAGESFEQYVERNLADFVAARNNVSYSESTSPKAFPWAVIIPIVIQLIERWMRK